MLLICLDTNLCEVPLKCHTQSSSSAIEYLLRNRAIFTSVYSFNSFSRTLSADPYNSFPKLFLDPVLHVHFRGFFLATAQVEKKESLEVY